MLHAYVKSVSSCTVSELSVTIQSQVKENISTSIGHYLYILNITKVQANEIIILHQMALLDYYNYVRHIQTVESIVHYDMTHVSVWSDLLFVSILVNHKKTRARLELCQKQHIHNCGVSILLFLPVILHCICY